LVGGFVIALIGFSNAFMLLIVLSLTTLFLNLQNNHHQRKNELSKIPFYEKILQKRSKSFWFHSFLQILVWVPFNVVSYFILPLYLRTYLNYSIEQTGFFVALFLTLIGIVSISSRKFQIKLSILYLLTFLIAIGFFLFIFSTNPILPILILSIGMGSSNILAEYLLSKSVHFSNEVSTDIGLMFVPLKMVEFFIYALGGFVVYYYGYSPLFVLCSLSILGFLYFSKSHFLDSKAVI
jgi:predicted MFS family arabinose efflux permease